jgi:hypothetical protein
MSINVIMRFIWFLNTTTETESPKSYKYPGYSDKSGSNSQKDSKFPGFMDQNISVPGSINGKPNGSLNYTRDNEFEDDDQPLESTR